VSPNKKLVERYLASSDRSKIAPLLADDVEWVEWAEGVAPTGVWTRGKAPVLANFGPEELVSEVTRLTEEGNVVVAEGFVRLDRKDGRPVRIRSCDTFEIENERVKRLSSIAVKLNVPE
jgi:uncharacterized protein